MLLWSVTTIRMDRMTLRTSRYGVTTVMALSEGLWEELMEYSARSVAVIWHKALATHFIQTWMYPRFSANLELRGFDW